MALPFTPSSPLLFKTTTKFSSFPPQPSLSLFPGSISRSPRLRISALSGEIPDPLPGNPPKTSGWNPADETVNDDGESDGATPAIVDEWGEKTEPDTEPLTKLPASDPPRDEDEWGGGVGVSYSPDEEERFVVKGNGSAAVEVGVVGDDRVEALKRCLVDTVYGSNLGFSASPEVRAEVLELVTQLEGLNPTPVPTDAVELLDGNWVLLYTAFSELLPLLAVGTTPLLKVEKICQEINTASLTIENSITYSSPFATFLFSASANFEVQSPSRIQVEFKEGTLRPPQIKSNVNLPENVDIFGQNINLSPVQQTLNPLQEAVAGIARAISGQTPIKIPIPGERTKSWLLFTYLDKDLRISRGDGGLFVLAKEGSPLLDQ